MLLTNVMQHLQHTQKHGMHVSTCCAVRKSMPALPQAVRAALHQHHAAQTGCMQCMKQRHDVRSAQL
jgi:hypothetical protein